MDSVEVNQRKERAAFLSIISNSTLVAGKFLVGFLTGSIGILSEAVHSSMDLVASGIAWWSVRKSGLPPDETHNYGHGKIETVSAVFESLLIVAAGVLIFWEAIQKIFHAAPIEEISWGLWIMGISTVVNILVSRYLFKVGQETESQALIADAHHLSSDVWSSIGVFGGLIIVHFTGWYWVDPAIALLVGLWIIRIGLVLCYEGIEGLIDTVLPEEEAQVIRHILDEDSRVHLYHHLRSRRSGSIRLIDFHIHLDHDMTLEDAHRITHEIKHKIESQIPKVDVIIHAEPCSEGSTCRVEFR